MSRKWLDEFVTVHADDKEFAEAMTLSGSKVETTQDLGAEIHNVVVGKVLSMERHPDSDHMWVCQVDVGQGEPVQIVTGAWNIHPGDMVPVALHKSTLPGGQEDREGQAPGRPLQRHALRPVGAGAGRAGLPLRRHHPRRPLNDYHPLDPASPPSPRTSSPGTRSSGPWCAPGWRR